MYPDTQSKENATMPESSVLKYCASGGYSKLLHLMTSFALNNNSGGSAIEMNCLS